MSIPYEEEGAAGGPRGRGRFLDSSASSYPPPMLAGGAAVVPVWGGVG